VAHNRKEHWQSLLYELWQAAGGDSWDRRIKWSCSSPVPTRHCLTACWKLGSPSSVAEDLLNYRRSCGWQWAGTTSASVICGAPSADSLTIGLYPDLGELDCDERFAVP
jgi:hypothetical protein